MALNRENINYQRNVVCRSHNVNYALLKEDLSRVSLCEWLGYLVLGIDGKVFLADSRAIFTHPSGSREYEWFYLNGVGAYSGDFGGYMYSFDSYADAIAHPYQGGEPAAYEMVYSATDNDGNTYYYVTAAETKYHVIPTEERYEGTFQPATTFISHDKLLFFTTDDGHVCVFNNDKRGVAPDSIKSLPDYDEEEYAYMMGNRIHPIFYSFAGHAPEYIIKTGLDDCGIPHLTKKTVKKSLVIKTKSYQPDAIECEVKADGNDPLYIGCLPPASLGFEDFNFIYTPWYVSRYTASVLPEHEKSWIEKQLILYSCTYASPISVYSISYRYTIKGKIKNNA